MTGQAIPNIRTFRPEDLVQVQDLFVNRLMEFAGGVEHEVRRSIDHSLQGDLADIPGQYLSNPRGNFWVADSGGAVLGMVGIQQLEQDDEAELRRMSLSSKTRRQGIGWRLLEATGDYREFLTPEWLQSNMLVFG